MTMIRHIPWTLWKYIGKFFMSRFLIIFLVLVAILQTLDMVGTSNEISLVHPNDSGILLEYLKLRIPVLADQFLPFSILLASIATFAGLSQTNEITSARAMGLTRLQIGMPMLFAAGVIGLMQLTASQLFVLPASIRLDAWQNVAYKGRPPETPPKPKNTFWLNTNSFIIHADDISARQQVLDLQGIEVIRRDGIESFSSIIRAQTGQIANGILRLNEGKVIAASSVRLLSAGWSLPISLNDQSLRAHRIRVKSASIPELVNALSSSLVDSSQRGEIRAQLHHYFATAALISVLPLVAIAVISGAPRARHRLWNMAAGLGLGFAFFVFDSVLFGIAGGGALPGWLAAWGTVLLFLGVTGSLLLRTEV